MLVSVKRNEMSPLPLVGVTALKNFLRIEHDEDDQLIESLERSAYEWIERYCGKSLLTTTWKCVWQPQRSSLCKVRLPYGPIQEISSIFTGKDNDKKNKKYRQVDDSCIEFYESSQAVTIEYEAGFGPHPRFVPECFHMAAKILTAYFYKNRECDNSSIPITVKQLLNNFTEQRIA